MPRFIRMPDGTVQQIPDTAPEQEQFTDEVEQPQERPESEQRTRWIGESTFPGAEKHSDGISDLFTVSDEDVGASDADLSDLTGVDLERDVIDADDDGTLDDLTRVTEEDIMGFEGTGQRPSAPASKQGRQRRIVRYQPPTSMRGMQ